MMPLCTTASSWLEKCGWALRSHGAPWVAQRVWAMPSRPLSGSRCLRLVQLGDLAGTAQARQLPAVVDHGDTGAVIAAVFQALEAFEQDGGDIAFGDGANDATHGRFS